MVMHEWRYLQPVEWRIVQPHRIVQEMVQILSDQAYSERHSKWREILVVAYQVTDQVVAGPLHACV